MSKLSAIGQTALVVILVVLIIVAAGAGYLASSSRTVISTLTTTQVGPTLATTFTITQTATTTEMGPTVTTIFSLNTTQSQVQQTSISCSISVEGGLALRILSNSTLQPVVGATVFATNTPASCNNTPATTQTTMKFTTNGTIWYSLPTVNDGGYSFGVGYSNQYYNFSAPILPVSVTCATLYLPSGKTNITINTGQTSCN